MSIWDRETTERVDIPHVEGCRRDEVQVYQVRCLTDLSKTTPLRIPVCPDGNRRKVAVFFRGRKVALTLPHCTQEHARVSLGIGIGDTFAAWAFTLLGVRLIAWNHIGPIGAGLLDGDNDVAMFFFRTWYYDVRVLAKKRRRFNVRCAYCRSRKYKFTPSTTRTQLGCYTQSWGKPQWVLSTGDRSREWHFAHVDRDQEFCTAVCRETHDQITHGEKQCQLEIKKLIRKIREASRGTKTPARHGRRQLHRGV